MNRGYIKLWRKSLDSKMVKNHKLWTMWTYFLLRATYKKKTVYIGSQEVSLEPGQLVSGRASLALALNMSQRSTRTCLNALKTTNKVSVKTTNKFSIITIINWDIYQSQELQTDQQTDQQANQQLTTNKEGKEKKEKETKKRRLTLLNV